MTLVAKLTPAAAMRVGDLRWYCGPINVSGEQVVKTGWLAANGASVLRAIYATLFGEIGTTYGSVDGTHFTLPNFTDGRNPIPKGATSFTVRGVTGGEYTHTLLAAEEPSHTHTFFDIYAFEPQANITDPSSIQFNNQPFGGDVTYTTSIPIGNSGAASAHQNMPPVIVTGGILIKF